MVLTEDPEVLDVLIAGSTLQQGPHPCLEVCGVKSAKQTLSSSH